MRRASILSVLALLVGIVIPAMAIAPATAGPGDHYVGPYFGENNFPPGCTRDNAADNPYNGCYRMATGLNGLDSPQVDVLVMVPVSPTAERDMRVMRQSVEMWEGGIQGLASQMGLGWLAEGVDFHVTVDYVDPDGGGGEFTTYPIVDPEIVVIATNPVGGAGIGVDPIDFAERTGIGGDGEGPCHPVPNPFDFDAWSSLPGFDSHHETRSGTYVEDCGGPDAEGGGGNVCFAVNGAIDPAPDQAEVFSLFDLVSHEFGHCLTLGHVGDGGETLLGNGWGAVPTNDIMSYNSDPPGLTKCVSTLDVEGFAIRMSGYLDVNGDGTVDAGDALEANDQIGSPDGLNPLHVQHPHDHHYASSTGSASDCPQPDVGLVPGERTDWTPDTVRTVEPTLTVTSPSADPATAGENGALTVAGTVEYRRIAGDPAVSMPPAPPAPPAYNGTLTVERRGSFEVEHSTFGVTDAVPAVDTSDTYSLDLTNADVAFSLTWGDLFPLPPPSNLDLFVTGAVNSGAAGATSAKPEVVSFTGVSGHLDIKVRPTFVNTFTTYTLTITVTPRDGAYGGLSGPDLDADGVVDYDDACPSYPGIGDDGCTPLRSTRVVAFLDGVAVGSADVQADYAAAAFSIPVTVPAGSHQLRLDWLDGERVLASSPTTTVVGPAVVEPDLDGDGIPDAGDSDIDGDGYSNDRELAKGSDPRDPASTPKTKRR